MTNDSAHVCPQTLTQKECEVLIPDPSARTAALNFLLGTVRFIRLVICDLIQTERVLMGVGVVQGYEGYEGCGVFPRCDEEGA